MIGARQYPHEPETSVVGSLAVHGVISHVHCVTRIDAELSECPPQWLRMWLVLRNVFTANDNVYHVARTGCGKDEPKRIAVPIGPRRAPAAPAARGGRAGDGEAARRGGAARLRHPAPICLFRRVAEAP